MERGRPKEYTLETEVRICAKGTSKLQEKSARKAIIQLLVNNKGLLSIGEINNHFGFDISDKVVALIRAGWLEVVK